MDKNKFWNTIDQAVANVKTWPKWKQEYGIRSALAVGKDEDDLFMKAKLGKPSSISNYAKERIEELSKHTVTKSCPCCRGKGTIKAPHTGDAKDDLIWFWNKLSEAYLLKPEGVELMLVGNALCVIEKPDEEGVLDVNKLRMFVPRSKIEYATSEIKYQFEEGEIPEHITEEMLQNQVLNKQ